MTSQLQRKALNSDDATLNADRSFQYSEPRLCVLSAARRIFSKGRFGFGVAIPAPNADEYVHSVGYVDSKGPAAVSGLRVKDVILKVDGNNTEDMTHEELVFYLRNEVKDTLRMIVVSPAQGETDPMA